ncbi:O-antigen ligase family protein [Clostridium perfringens]|nr:O-antigen ligase family protein [Clostridium perfringens]
MKEKKIVINKITIISFICFIFYFKPFYVTYYNITSINEFYVWGLRILFIVGIILYLSSKRISNLIIILSLFYCVKIISTLLNNGDVMVVISEIYTTLGACILIELFSRKNFIYFLKGLRNAMFILMIISTLTTLYNPYGFNTIYDKVYFQRPGNQLASFMIIVLFISVLYSKIKFGKKLTLFNICLILSSFFIAINVRSASGIVAVTTFFIYLVINDKNKIIKLVNIKNVFLVYTVFYLSIIVFKLQEVFSEIIVGILGKDLTFTGRTILWDSAKEIISKNLYLGIGTQSSTNLIYDPGSCSYLSTHNQILQLLVENGFISLIMFFAIIAILLIRVKNINNKIELLISVTLLSMLLVLFSEAMGFFDLFFVISITYNIPKIKKENSYE